MRYLVSALLTVILTAIAVPASGHGPDRLRGSVSVEVVSDQGGALLVIPHKNFRNGMTRVIKQYLEAKKGENYGIVIRNMTDERIGVVVAVDGRNIISGKQSDLGSGEDMYIVDQYSQGTYDGWRTDKDRVHRFYFTDPGDSYSVRTFGDASAMGVIAVAVYREKDRPLPREFKNKRKHGPAAPSAESGVQGRSSAQADLQAGTGFGDERYSPTIRVAFEPERIPAQKNLIKYEWRETLCRKGIIRCGRETGNRLWDDGYAPYPPGHRN